MTGVSRRPRPTGLIAIGAYALFGDWDDVYLLNLADLRWPALADAYHTWDYAELVPNQLATDGVRCLVAARESGLLLLELGGEGGESPGTAYA